MKPVPYLPLALLLAAAGCKKNELNALPKATQQGKNTMGCLVDGKAWTPEGSSGGLVGGGAVDPIFAFWRRQRSRGGNLTLAFRRRPDKGEESDILFFVPSLAGPGNFALDQTANPALGSSNPAYGQFIRYDNYPSTKYLTGPDAGGSLLLTRLDTIACVASGTFEFTARDPAGQPVRLTHGRFDVRFAK